MTPMLGASSSSNSLLTSLTWCDEMEVLIDPTCDGYVSISDFKSFLGWFGPLNKCCANVETLVSAPWFYGSITSLEAQTLLDEQDLGTYIVRFNENKPGSFYISCTEEKVDEDGTDFLNSRQNVLQTVRYTVHKTEKHKFYLYVGEEMDSIEQLLSQYDLTFSQGFNNQDIKYKSIMEHRIAGEEKSSQLLDFLRQTFVGLDRELRLSDLNFATFRGRVPDMPHMKKAPKQKKSLKSRSGTGSETSRRLLVARKSGVPADFSSGQLSLADRLQGTATEMIEMVDMPSPTSAPPNLSINFTLPSTASMMSKATTPSSTTNTPTATTTTTTTATTTTTTNEATASSTTTTTKNDVTTASSSSASSSSQGLAINTGGGSSSSSGSGKPESVQSPLSDESSDVNVPLLKDDESKAK